MFLCVCFVLIAVYLNANHNHRPANGIRMDKYESEEYNGGLALVVLSFAANVGARVYMSVLGGSVQQAAAEAPEELSYHSRRRKTERNSKHTQGHTRTLAQERAKQGKGCN